MTNKAYIVANEQQEHSILKKFEQDGLRWHSGEKPTEWKPVNEGALCSLPYALVVKDYVSWDYVAWSSLSQLTDEEIVYDGRKTPDHIKVPNEIIRDIKKYVDNHNSFAWLYDFSTYPKSVCDWILKDTAERIKLLVDYIEGNITLITTEQYVVRSIDPDENGDYSYLRLGAQSTSVPNIEVAQFELQDATHFETREEASKFLISGMEIVEV